MKLLNLHTVQKIINDASVYIRCANGDYSGTFMFYYVDWQKQSIKTQYIAHFSKRSDMELYDSKGLNFCYKCRERIFADNVLEACLQLGDFGGLDCIYKYLEE